MAYNSIQIVNVVFATVITVAWNIYTSDIGLQVQSWKRELDAIVQFTARIVMKYKPKEK